MNKEKQIEEMAKDLGIAFQLAGTTRFGEVAECLVSAGYRKASEVAREIFEEIEQVRKEIVDRMQEFINEWKQYSESTVDYFGGKYDAMETASRIVKSILTDKTAELKKKYTETTDDE